MNTPGGKHKKAGSGAKIVFLNQMAGPLFRELSEDLAYIWRPSMLYTSHPHTVRIEGTEFLTVKPAPEYDRSSNFKRLWSWLCYFKGALTIVRGQPADSVLFIVSNPPILGLIGLIFKLIRKQKYIVLVYDIYPDLLVGLKRLKKGALFKLWNILNCIVYQNADVVITIGKDMTANLEKRFDTYKTEAKKVICIPNWVDVEKIKPIPKNENWFARQHNLVDKTVVLYSGNMGNTHNIEAILEAAVSLSNKMEICFLFIGEGEKWKLVERTIEENGLKNIILLPFQEEKVLPYSLSSGDIGIVSYQKGTETFIVPSKTYYYMAAGLSILVVSDKENEISSMIDKYACGVNVSGRDINGIAKTIDELSEDKQKLERFKKLSRKTAVENFSRKNTEMFAEVVRNHACPLN